MGDIVKNGAGPGESDLHIFSGEGEASIADFIEVEVPLLSAVLVGGFLGELYSQESIDKVHTVVCKRQVCSLTIFDVLFQKIKTAIFEQINGLEEAMNLAWKEIGSDMSPKDMTDVFVDKITQNCGEGPFLIKSMEG